MSKTASQQSKTRLPHKPFYFDDVEKEKIYELYGYHNYEKGRPKLVRMEVFKAPIMPRGKDYIHIQELEMDENENTRPVGSIKSYPVTATGEEASANQLNDLYSGLVILGISQAHKQRKNTKTHHDMAGAGRTKRRRTKRRRTRRRQ